ncbi:Endonuclease, Uma2 family [Nostoc flagelliforme CCNUN1]|uniref:Endonuclease, Uma2 family n=1 Tax=Nostoc flagelliforme CCNUN1 TaxID=2038116 RepID=A0A2K8SNH6_9NOSO|nr:Uma2 family endonuclease [Nostoc flagelliforme]AUB36958.1 Endonuclease, Uma2 family [Nostoc flagelliforme CCNUN1]
MNTVVLNLEPIAHLTDEQFYQLCIANRDLSLEMNAAGELIIVPPVGGESGNQEAGLIADLEIWNRQAKLGKVFSFSTIFILPNGAKRSPDAAWVKLERWQALTPEQRKKFPPLVPDFLTELRSETDRLAPIQEKMQEYIKNQYSSVKHLFLLFTSLASFSNETLRVGGSLSKRRRFVKKIDFDKEL